MKKLLLSVFIAIAVAGQSETRCFFTEVVVTVIVTRCLYDLLKFPDYCDGHCNNHKLCEKIQQLRHELEDLKCRVKHLEQ